MATSDWLEGGVDRYFEFGLTNEGNFKRSKLKFQYFLFHFCIYSWLIFRNIRKAELIQIRI